MKPSNCVIEKQHELFDKMYAAIAKVVSFNKEWHTGSGTIGGVVEGLDRRLIMQQTEYAKTVDNFGRKIILMGSHFGTIAVYPSGLSRTSVAPLGYYATEAFANAMTKFLGRHVAKNALLKNALNLQLLDFDQFLTQMTELKTFCIGCGIPVGDGLPTFAKPVRRKHIHKPLRLRNKKPSEAPPAVQAKKKQHEKKPANQTPAPAARVDDTPHTEFKLGESKPQQLERHTTQHSNLAEMFKYEPEKHTTSHPHARGENPVIAHIDELPFYAPPSIVA